MIGWFRKPTPRAVLPEPAQFAAALQALRLAEQIVAGGDERRVREVAEWILRERRRYRRDPRRT